VKSWIGSFVLLLSLAAPACERSGGTTASASSGAPDADRRAELRTDALRRAKVWSPPATPISDANLAENPPVPGGFAATADVSCRFTLEAVGGTTPKFNCELPGGDVVKVKYGPGNPELHAEVAATRLLAALGFGADRMFLVRSVRCAGCPRFPFQTLQCVQKTGWKSACVPGGLDYSRVIDIAPAVIERRMPGTTIEAPPISGWAWYELPAIDPAAGGAQRAEVDALRLMAVMISHWDNKSENQRLVCLPGGERPDGSCASPFALMQDLGGSFGPIKVDLRNWRAAPVWADARRCTVSMKHLPWGGATFPDARISESGRRHFLSLVEQLSEAQLHALFQSSGVTGYDQIASDARDASAWARVFLAKVNAVRAGGPCPVT
jgi:hypothetical protein